MNADECVGEVLLANGWTTEEVLQNVTVEDRKTLLMIKLAKSLNKNIHTMIDLSAR